MIIEDKKKFDDKPRPLPPAKKLLGARIYSVVDKGTQEGSYEGKPTYRRKIRVSFELDAYMEDGRPFAAHRDYTANVRKGALADDLETILGELPQVPFDTRSMLGLECALSIRHETNPRTGKTYAEIATIMNAELTGKRGPEQNQNKQIYFSLDEFDKAVYDALPEFLRLDIARSPEYLQAVTRATTTTTTTTATDDDVPF